jgi:hypothetical protein
MDPGQTRRVSVAAVRETVGLIGIIGSLVFVGLQIRQNTAVARGQTRQQLTAMSQEWLMLMSTDSVFRVAFSKAWFEDSDSLTDNERAIANWGMRMMVRRLENVYLQFREGLVDESALTTYGFQSKRIPNREVSRILGERPEYE